MYTVAASIVTDRQTHTHTHTYTQNDYCNPAAHAQRVNNMHVYSYLITTVISNLGLPSAKNVK